MTTLDDRSLKMTISAAMHDGQHDVAYRNVGLHCVRKKVTP